jgi:SAM-dependent methyltransferase
MNAIETVCRTLQNLDVISFAQDTLITGYHPYFPEKTEQMQVLVEEALGWLVASQQAGADVNRLIKATTEVIRGIYHKEDSTFWFNQVYHHYKTEIKPRTDVEQLRPLIYGQRVLDYGCGSGYLSARLDRAGFQVFTTDVLDYRYAEAKHLPFVQMQSPTEIGYPADSIDTAIIQAVLHHIDTPDLAIILPRLAKVTHRLLIKEDSYGLPADLPGLDEKKAQQPLLARFLDFPLPIQFQILVLIDYYANAVAQGIPEMHMPFQFRTPDEWRQVLAANGFSVERTLVAGFEPGRMHQSCHIWLVCERQTTPDTVAIAGFSKLARETDVTDKHGSR